VNRVSGGDTVFARRLCAVASPHDLVRAGARNQEKII